MFLYSCDTLIFDLDGTLSRSEGHTNVVDQTMLQIRLLASEMTGMEMGPGLYRLLHSYYLRYGTTIRGLMEHHQVDPIDAHERIISPVDYSVIMPDLELSTSLENGRRIGLKFGISTAAPRKHLDLVLERLGVAPELFNQGIFTAEHVYFAPKDKAFQSMLAYLDINVPEKACLLEDSPKVAHAAKDAGMYSVLVTDDPESKKKYPFIDMTVQSTCSFVRHITSVRAGHRLYLPTGLCP